VIIALTMDELSSSETGNFYQTARRNISEDSHLHTRPCENLTSYNKAHSLYQEKIGMDFISMEQSAA
jgi:hypothetical protein